MTRRALVAIGCDAYLHLNPLSGAESDAKRMFDALIRPEVGDYDVDVSRLLLSPELVELRSAIDDILFRKGPIDTFTFFFAGHGGVKSGSFYLCLKDSLESALSISAFSLADLFLRLSESIPSQSNIIIDACQSGGLVGDLGVLLKSDLIGDAGTPGITLLATSAQDQESWGTSAGGFGTNAVLDCILGGEFIQDARSALDLVEIGSNVSTTLGKATGQNPVVWGLNLYGPPRFCRNPHFVSEATISLRKLIASWPSSSDRSMESRFDELWKAYSSIDVGWDPRRFADILAPVIQELKGTPAALRTFVERFTSALQTRFHQLSDPFRPSQVIAATAVSLLKASDGGLVDQVSLSLHNSVCEELVAATRRLLGELDVNRYALLSGRGGLADLYYLPIRISKVLGWAALPLLMQNDASAQMQSLFRDLLRRILDLYGASIVTMNDAQAPYWTLILASANRLGLSDEARTLATRLFDTLTACAGHLADVDIPHEKVLTYLLLRAQNSFHSHPELIARPNTTATILLRTAKSLGLGEAFDHDLWKLDGLQLGAYLPDDFTLFGDPIMQGGENINYKIGHDVFNTRELEAAWTGSARIRPASEAVAGSVLCASLLFPDRIPWFLLEPTD